MLLPWQPFTSEEEMRLAYSPLSNTAMTLTKDIAVYLLRKTGISGRTRTKIQYAQ